MCDTTTHQQVAVGKRLICVLKMEKNNNKPDIVEIQCTVADNI